MVAIDNDFAIGNVRDAEKHVFIIFFAHAFKAHSYFDIRWKEGDVFNLDKAFIVVAKGFFRLEFNLKFVAGFFAMKGFFDGRENAVIAAM